MGLSLPELSMRLSRAPVAILRGKENEPYNRPNGTQDGRPGNRTDKADMNFEIAEHEIDEPSRLPAVANRNLSVNWKKEKKNPSLS